MRQKNVDRRQRWFSKRSRGRRRHRIFLVLAVLCCCGVVTSAASLYKVEIPSRSDRADSAARPPTPSEADEATLTELVEDAKDAFVSLFQRLSAAFFSSQPDSSAAADCSHSPCRHRRSRRKRALTFHLDPVDGAQLILATIMVLAAGILFALTIDSIRVGAKYGFFPVGVKFTRFFPLELGSALNAPGGIIYPPPGFKEPPPEDDAMTNGNGNGGGSYAVPPDTTTNNNGGGYGGYSSPPSNDYYSPAPETDDGGKYSAPAVEEAPISDEYGPPQPEMTRMRDSYSSAPPIISDADYSAPPSKSSGYSSPSPDYEVPEPSSDYYGPPTEKYEARQAPFDEYEPTSEEFGGQPKKGYNYGAPPDQYRQSAHTSSPVPSAPSVGASTEGYGPSSDRAGQHGGALLENTDGDYSAPPSTYYAPPAAPAPAGPSITRRYSSVSYKAAQNIHRPSPGQDVSRVSASYHARYADPVSQSGDISHL